MAFFCHHFYGHFSYISKIKMFMKMSFNKSHTKDMEITEMSLKLNYLCVAWKMKEIKQKKKSKAYSMFHYGHHKVR